ncbi:unnamed protein product [Enterobius vermicularis]|uniref:MSP domain-containing protein n=1 Tax=Enterobius vermicularis TaxID=51028 RepID=A0A0N4UVD7_ENTVE|nr:unnamed protein product [Enterobius vermicularis]
MPMDLPSTFVLPDPWAELRQFSIRPPDSTNKENENSLKRPATPMECHAIKRLKKDSGMGLQQVKLEPFEEATYKDEYRYEDSYDARGFDIQDGCFAIRCKNGTRIDPDLAPVSSECSEVQILVENEILLVPPLRIVVPVNYPETGATVWSDPRVTNDPTLMELNSQFDKHLVMTPDANSIPQILHAWKVASHYIYKSSASARRSRFS